jgi:L-ascorbate metabolism protein UlaG (beta-lactamase superfamily)
MDIQMLERLRWVGHDSFVLEGSPTIYFDPWKLPRNMPRADIILVSHEHGDHCSPEDIAKVSSPTTVIIANPTAAPKLSGDVRVMQPGDKLVLDQVTVEAVPAYNLNKFRSPGNPFHPKAAKHNGYVVTMGEERVYFAGDTDHIPEMSKIRCDIALLPVSGTYVMTAAEATEAARAIQPRVAIPMHYGAGVVGTAQDAAAFKAALLDVPVLILTAG